MSIMRMKLKFCMKGIFLLNNLIYLFIIKLFDLLINFQNKYK